MVSLVLVSHSRILAEAVLSLVRQVASPEVKIACAAGVGADRLEFGTDAIQISEAIASVHAHDGTLVLMDLGSAILSAEMALDFLPEDMRVEVRLCAAPLVEGAISAAIAAGLGTALDGVEAEAMESLRPKQEHLGSAVPVAARTDDGPVVGHDDHPSVTVIMPNANGLHARPAARFVQTAGQFDAEIFVQKTGAGNSAVSARSLNKLVTLGLTQGDAMTITATGSQAQQALEALSALVKNGFGESTSTLPDPIPATPKPTKIVDNSGYTHRITPIAEGIALGPLRRVNAARSGLLDATSVDSPEVEWLQVQNAIARVIAALRARHMRLSTTAQQQAGDIFNSHQLILQDAELLSSLRQAIYERKISAEQAWQSTIAAQAEVYRAMSDPYLRQREVDINDIGAQVLSELTGVTDNFTDTWTTPSILLSDDYTPSQVAELDPKVVLGLISRQGSSTSHASILARSLGMPMLAGARDVLDDVSNGTCIGLDGSSGLLWVDPSLEIARALTDQRLSWLAHREHMRLNSQTNTVTQDGRRVEIAANISGITDSRVAVANGAEAVGVLRTEFLYLTRSVAPTEEEQVTTLSQIAAAMQGRPVIVRTLDIGGDKPIPYMNLPIEANPFLGVRAIRLSLLNPSLFITQIRAILRAGHSYPCRILLPMITLVEELVQSHKLIEQAHSQLAAEGVAHAWPIPIGIMVETPAAALMTHEFAPMVDFFSVGTNDLTQYTLAAERSNPNLGHLSDALHPSILRLIDIVVSEAHALGKWVGVCGEVAADPVAIPVLVGLGVDELSMNVSAIPQAKAIVRRINSTGAITLAKAALRTDMACAVRDLVGSMSVVSGEQP